MMKKYFLLTTFICFGLLSAQDFQSNGLYLFDRFGQTIEAKGSSDPGAMPLDLEPCQAGHFLLDFDQSNLYESITDDERTVICQVFTDLSELIAPVGTPEVRIKIGNTASGNSQANASSYYVGYFESGSYVPEIYDGLVWKYINTGVDPLSDSEGTGLITPFYNHHGELNINSSQDFYTDLSTDVSGGIVDLYTVVLHEAIHLLGHVSFMGVFESGLGYDDSQIYSRYDLFLENNGSPMLNNIDCYTYTGTNIPELYSGIDLLEQCDEIDVYFVGDNTNEPIYRKYEYGGSHLSHLLSDCPSNGGLHYVMTAQLADNQSYRYPLQEEVNVLCDLGYQTTNTYGTNSSLLSYFSPYTTCGGNTVAGVIDVIDVDEDSQETFTAINFTENDINADDITCLEALSDEITLFDDGTGNYTVTIPAVVGFDFYLLRYIPIDENGNQGNTTYVILNVSGGSLCGSPDVNEPCNLLCGGDFENFPTSLDPFDNWPIADNSNIDALGSSINSALSPFSGDSNVLMFGNVGNVSGMYLEFNAPLIVDNTYTLRVSTRYTMEDANGIRFLGSTTLPCPAFTGVENAVIPNTGTGLVPITNCADGSDFAPIDLGYVTANTTEWTTYEFTFDAQEAYTYLVFVVENSLPAMGGTSAIFVDALSVTGEAVFELDAGEDISMCFDSEGVVLGGSGLDEFGVDAGFQWTPTDGLSNPNIAHPIANPESTTEYFVTATSTECSISGEGSVSVNVEDCCAIVGANLDFSNKTAIEVLAEYAPDFGSTYNDKTIQINGTFTIDTDIHFLNSFIEMGPNAEIIYDPALTNAAHLEIETTNVYACSETMWKGITAIGTLNELSISRTSLIRDAFVAVSASDCAEINISSSTFKANRADISVANCDQDYSTSISSNQFFNEDLLNPYTGTEAVLSIRFNNTTVESLSQCNFYEYKNAISVQNSSIDMLSNTINNVEQDGNVAVNLRFVTSSHTLNTIGNTYDGYNYGVTNSFPVVSNGGVKFQIQSDVYNNIKGRAIDIRNRIGNYSYIKACNFTNVNYGIVVQSVFLPVPSLPDYNDPGRRINIEDNNMEQVSRTGIFLTNLPGSYVYGTIGSIPEVLTVKNNDIILNPFDLNIFGDNVLIDGEETNVQRGIRVENSFRAIIDNNDVSGPGDLNANIYRKVKGISVSDTRDGRIRGNTLSRMGDGLHIIGLNQKTKIECNDMEDCYRGINFDDGSEYGSTLSISTVITDQGGDDDPTDNRWIDNVDTRIIGGLDLSSSSDQVKWYYRNVPSHFPQMELTTALNFNLLPLSNTFEFCNTGSLPSPGGGGGIAGITVPEYEDMVDDNNSYGTLNESFKYKDKDFVYRKMFADGSLYGESLVLDNFFTLMEDSGFDRQIQIHRDMADGDLQTAIERNEDWIAANLHETNSKTVNEVYLRSVAIDQEISAQDKESLEEIALTTPYLSGDAVYSARVLLGVDASIYGIQYRTVQPIINTGIKLYPNPTSGIFSIAFDSILENNRTFKCYDVTGKLLRTKNLVAGAENYQMDLSHLPAGIYIIDIEETGVSLLKERLILTH